VGETGAVHRLTTAREIVQDYGYVLGRRWLSLRRGMTPPPPSSTPTARPVLLIPGVFETWHYLDAVGTRLREQGHAVHHPVELGFTRRPIPETAMIVQRYLERLDLRDVVIVGHSKGGLIGKLLLMQDRDARIAHLVAINAPFPGSPLARYAVSAWREFSPARPVIRELAAATEVDDRIVSIYSRFDQYVPGTSRLAGARNVEIPVAGHFRVLAHPQVLDTVARWAAEPAASARPSSAAAPRDD
jgi:pimeloyl-ACP methyl ester carboxylesterase